MYGGNAANQKNNKKTEKKVKEASRFVVAIIAMMMAFVFGSNRAVAQGYSCLNETRVMYPEGSKGVTEAHVQITGNADGSLKFRAFQTPASWVYTVNRWVVTQAWYTYSNGHNGEMVLNNRTYGREGGGGSVNTFDCFERENFVGIVKFVIVITIYDSAGRFVCSNQGEYYNSSYFPNYETY